MCVWKKHRVSRTRPDILAWYTYLIFLPAIYLPDLLAWSTCLIFLPDLLAWSTCLIFLPDLLAWSTDLINLPVIYLPVIYLPDLMHRVNLSTEIFTRSLKILTSIIWCWRDNEASVLTRKLWSGKHLNFNWRTLNCLLKLNFHNTTCCLTS